MENMESFDQWKDFLARGVEMAKQVGADEESIVEVAEQFGSYLAQEVDPANSQQRLLKELWDRGTPEQQQALAHMIVQLVSDGRH